MKRKLWALLVAVFLPVLAHATVTGTSSTVTFTCTNSTGPFSFTFPALDASSLLVIEITPGANPGVMTVLTSSQWTSTPVNNSYANGGSVTLTTACPTGYTLVIARATEPTQLTHYTPNMPALYANFENNLDQLTTGRQDTYRVDQLHIGTVGSSGTSSGSASVAYTPLGQFLNLLFPSFGSGGGGGGGVPVAIDMTAAPCNVPNDHVTDITAAFNSCLNLYTNSGAGAATYAFFLPRTNTAVSAHGSCDYVASGTLIIPKTLYEPTIYGQTQGEDLGSRICTTTTNTTGMLDNTQGATLRNLTFYGADGWVSSNTATYVITGTADGVRTCGPNTHFDHVAALYYSRHGLNADSGACFGGATDFDSADSFQMYFPYTALNQGNGINVAGSDGNLGIILGGTAFANQLFGFQDRSLYPATVIGLNTTANHNDTNAVTGTTSLTSCSVTSGTMTCTCPSACGIQTFDVVTIAGSSNSSYNSKYEYTPAASSGTGATSFTMLTGDVGPNDSTSTTGGTVSYSPGARIWGTDNVYGGCCYASISGQGNWIGMYAEGNQPGPMVNSMVNIIGAGGTAGNTAFYYAGTGGFANTDAGGFSVLGAGIAMGSPTGKLSYQQVQNVNPSTRRLMCSIFRPGDGIAGGGGVDVGWSAQAGWCNGITGGTTPEVLEVGRSNSAPNSDGYWALTDNDSVLTTPAKTFARYYDLNATTHLPGTVEFPNPNPVLFDTTPLIGSAPIPVTTASPSANQAVCIKSTGPPIVLGTCSTVVSAGGSCTCN